MDNIKIEKRVFKFLDDKINLIYKYLSNIDSINDLRLKKNEVKYLAICFVLEQIGWCIKKNLLLLSSKYILDYELFIYFTMINDMEYDKNDIINNIFRIYRELECIKLYNGAVNG